MTVDSRNLLLHYADILEKDGASEAERWLSNFLSRAPLDYLNRLAPHRVWREDDHTTVLEADPFIEGILRHSLHAGYVRTLEAVGFDAFRTYYPDAISLENGTNGKVTINSDNIQAETDKRYFPQFGASLENRYRFEERDKVLFKKLSELFLWYDGKRGQLGEITGNTLNEKYASTKNLEENTIKRLNFAAEVTLSRFMGTPNVLGKGLGNYAPVQV